MILVLCGKTGTGKTTVAKKLEKRGYERIVTYTTRPKRERLEVEGVDYHFLSTMDFYARSKEGFFLETEAYTDDKGIVRFYGSAKSDYERASDKNKVVILTPAGIKQLKKTSLNFRIVYLDVPESLCLERALKRGGETMDGLKTRLDIDEKRFRVMDEEELYDIWIPIDRGMTADQITDIILRELGRQWFDKS